MIELAWPWWLSLLVLPWVAFWLLPPAKPAIPASLKIPFFDRVQAHSNAQNSKQLPPWFFIGSLVAWALLILACCRPQWTGEPIDLPRDGRQLMLAVDVSGSMDEADMLVAGRRATRLQAVQNVAADFIRRRDGDQLGLILFGEFAYLQSPLTFDRETVATLLSEAFLGIAGTKTAIGDAIGLAVKRVDNNVEQSKKPPVLILLTDGSSNAGALQPMKATELAAEIGLKIYTIAFGSETNTGFFNFRRNEIDTQTLSSIAKTSGGKFFRAEDTKSLERIYQAIDKLEAVEAKAKPFRPSRELFFWPLGLALVIFAIMLAIREWQARQGAQ